MTADLEALVLRDIERHGPTPMAEVAWRCGTSRRSVEEAVQRLRLAGRPIVAAGVGVKLATRAAEVAEWRRSFRDRLVAMVETDRAMADAERVLALSEQSYDPEAGFWGMA